jgi:hypothetical protein
MNHQSVHRKDPENVRLKPRFATEFRRNWLVTGVLITLERAIEALDAISLLISLTLSGMGRIWRK